MKYLSRLFLVAFLTATAGSAFAQCMPHDDVVQNLQKTYGETPVGLGVTPRGQQVIELFASEDGSWTILMTGTNGMSCVKASGSGWTDLPRVEVAEDNPI